jgi:pimeloyl-ACP methyl ester carboxylesterase
VARVKESPLGEGRLSGLQNSSPCPTISGPSALCPDRIVGTGAAPSFYLFFAALVVTALNADVSGASDPRGTTSVVDATVKVVRATMGNVAYRSFGRGPFLVLIMGYAGTMDTWDPNFIDDLAQHFRVITFDNAGIGGTAALREPLSIDGMAEQTSALITALHLGSPDVLGWSMGSMIAQALAILHPSQVHRLILCATYPGTGDAVPPSQADIAALTGSSAKAARLDLFPANQFVAASAFDGSVAAYPASLPAPASAIATQASSILAWFNGHVSTGHELAEISVPTLVADGTDDRIDASVNDRHVAAQMPHSRSLFYPDAGHAFLFPEGVLFAFQVQTFLLGTPTSVSVSVLRERYLAGNKIVTSTGKSWLSKLKSLSKMSTLRDVASNDLILADALSAFDDELLSSGASGHLGKAVSAFVAAEEQNVSVVLALAGQSASSIKGYSTISVRDGHAALILENVLRRDLKLSPVVTATTTTATTLLY